MKISELRLEDFRNYASERVVFDDGINIVNGRNAAGKTNLLEAIYLFAIGKSPLAVKDKELVRMGALRAHISADVFDMYRTRKMDVVIDSSGRKQIAVDSVPLLKVSELLGTFNVVFFSPDDLKMISEAPSDRRKFTDVSLSQQSKLYGQSLTRYNYVLAQRNKLLKTFKNKQSTLDTLEVWDGELIKAGAEVLRLRNEFITRLIPLAREKHFYLSGESEELTLSYDGITENYLDAFTAALCAARDKDIELAYTTVGPHRDDIAIRVNDTDVRKYGSRGQQRTASLALKLAETEVFRKVSGEYPVLLLDDVMSELDDTRKSRLISAVDGIQTFITDTTFKCDNARKFLVDSGKVLSY